MDLWQILHREKQFCMTNFFLLQKQGSGFWSKPLQLFKLACEVNSRTKLCWEKHVNAPVKIHRKWQRMHVHISKCQAVADRSKKNNNNNIYGSVTGAEMSNTGSLTLSSDVAHTLKPLLLTHLRGDTSPLLTPFPLQPLTCYLLTLQLSCLLTRILSAICWICWDFVWMSSFSLFSLRSMVSSLFTLFSREWRRSCRSWINQRILME